MSEDMAIRPHKDKKKIEVVIRDEEGEHVLPLKRDFILTLMEGLVLYVPQEKLWEARRNIPNIPSNVGEIVIVRYVV